MHFLSFPHNWFHGCLWYVFLWMLLNWLVPYSSGEPSPTRVLLHEYRGLRGFTIFIKHIFQAKIIIETHSYSVDSSHGKFMIFHVSGHRVLHISLYLFWDAFSRPLAPFWRHLAPLWLPFDCLLVTFWPPFGNLQLTFGSLSMPFRAILLLQAPFRFVLGSSCCILGPRWAFKMTQNAIKAAQVIPKDFKNKLPDQLDFWERSGLFFQSFWSYGVRSGLPFNWAMLLEISSRFAYVTEVDSSVSLLTPGTAFGGPRVHCASVSILINLAIRICY